MPYNYIGTLLGAYHMEEQIASGHDSPSGSHPMLLSRATTRTATD
jgi:hypothetical protein